MISGAPSTIDFLVAFVFKTYKTFSRNSCRFTSIQNPRGVTRRPRKNSDRSLETSQLFCLYLLPPLPLSLRSFFVFASFIFSGLRTLFAKHRGWGWVASRVYSPRRLTTHFALISPRCYHEVL